MAAELHIYRATIADTGEQQSGILFSVTRQQQVAVIPHLAAYNNF